MRVVAKKLGWVEVGDDAQWHVCWTDTSSGTDRLMRVRQPQVNPGSQLCQVHVPNLQFSRANLHCQPYAVPAPHTLPCNLDSPLLCALQKLNHFPGMLEIARKKSMARNLANMRTVYPEHYNFNPRTFLLPEMMEPFLAEVGKARKTPRTFIMKLDNGSQVC